MFVFMYFRECTTFVMMWIVPEILTITRKSFDIYMLYINNSDTPAIPINVFSVVIR